MDNMELGGGGGGSNKPTGRKYPVKPALKSSASMDEDDESMGDASSSNNNNRSKKKSGGKKPSKNSKKNRTLKWDEAKIQEHDQLRGTRMKIEEPNTPFAHYDSGSETDGSWSSARGSRNHGGVDNHKISWDALTNKLEAHAAAKDQVYPPSSPSHTSDGNYTTDEEGEDQKRERLRKEMKRLEFQEHRKSHYNEMEVVRRFRRDYPDGEPTVNGHHASNEDTDDDVDNDGDDENE
mmetsp:Transcript_6667/g.15945  ORF Transcript_6667/g.15945 Transcript_6667/m.15945 type:complete len:236 (+) Transcript_6667:362-1069(+)